MSNRESIPDATDVFMGWEESIIEFQQLAVLIKAYSHLYIDVPNASSTAQSIQHCSDMVGGFHALESCFRHILAQNEARFTSLWEKFHPGASIPV